MTATTTPLTPEPWGRNRKRIIPVEACIVETPTTRELLIMDEPLMGMAEVADALAVRVQNIARIPGLPDPVSRIRATRIWLGHEVTTFREYREKRKAVHGR